MRRVALLAAALLAGAALPLSLVASNASALSPAGPHATLGKALAKGESRNDTVQLVRRGFGGGHGFRGGGFRGHAFRGGGFRGHAFRGGGFRGHAFRGGRAWRGHAFRAGPAWRGHAFRGGRAWRGHAFRGGRHFGWRGGHRGWRRAGWGAPFFYGGYCPLVRRTVWTPYGWRVRWVRRCW